MGEIAFSVLLQIQIIRYGYVKSWYVTTRVSVIRTYWEHSSIKYRSSVQQKRHLHKFNKQRSICGKRLKHRATPSGYNYDYVSFDNEMYSFNIFFLCILYFLTGNTKVGLTYIVEMFMFVLIELEEVGIDD